ncbi:MAG TPA: DUF1385 domain-containing protein [Bryobacteraceae bacterium]|nr:DUF1385 domain-containing protein [Bryobacteraceae bacterium]
MSVRTFFRLFTSLQMMPVLESGEETLVGGQAVVEGVMMRAPHSYCVAVRQPDGKIVTEELPLERMSEKYKIFKYPLFRGVGTLFQAMKLGGRALKFSAEASLVDEKVIPSDKKKEEIPGWAFLGPLIFSLAFYILAYKFVPLYLATRLGKIYPALAGQFASSTVGGIVRMGILLGILFGVSKLKDMRRIFEYHGAEHKVVFNFESGQPVTVENAQRYTTFHPRCGTSFLFVLFLLTIPVYALIPFSGFLAKLLCQIALIPVLVGLSYELIRFAAKRRGSMLAVLTAPGLWMQRITTKPPADDQASVAIHALEGAMALEKSQGGQLVIA